MRKEVLAAALIGLGFTTGSFSDAPSKGKTPTDAEKPQQKCWGLNDTKDTASCGVGSSDIKAANAAIESKDLRYNKKFGVSSQDLHDCAGAGACSAKEGHLGFKYVDDEGACFKAGGFLIVAQGDKKTVRTK